MARTQHLTDKFCAAAPGPGAAGYLIHHDDEVKGFGLRVTRKLARSFVLDYYTRAGDRRRLTIGTFGDWSTAEARKHARGLRVEVDRGHDPQGERTQRRQAPRVSDLVERWRQEHSPRNKPRSQTENERLIAQWILPELGNQLVAEVRFRDVDALHRKITFQRGTSRRANRVIALVSRLFTLAMRWEWCERNPAHGIERNAETARARYVKPEGELERLKAALATHPDRQAAQIVRLLLLTGARSSEVFTARWEHIDLDRNVWTLSATNTKEKRAKHLPLPAATRSLLVEIARSHPATDGTEVGPAGQNSGDRVPKTGWVLPWKGGHRHDIRHEWEKLARAAELDGLRLHDLRHSFASFGAAAGMSLLEIGALMGHSSPTTTKRYTHLFDAPLRAGVEGIAAIIAGAGATSEPLPPARAGAGTADLGKIVALAERRRR